LLYNELAFTYDLVSWIVSLGAWRCWTRAALKHIRPQGAILELAHGTGHLQLDLRAAGRAAIGYDLSPAMGRIAWGKLARRGLRPRLVRGRAQLLPFRAEAFASVISTFPTDFIIAPETLNDVHRVLQPNGCFVIVPTSRFVGGGLAARALDALYAITGQRGGNGAAAHHTVWRDLFAAHGFAAQFIEEACPHSLVTVIVAEKRD
jgi:ubiquinone/menaquinone biosynthesis C-methylase UbiE